MAYKKQEPVNLREHLGFWWGPCCSSF